MSNIQTVDVHTLKQWLENNEVILIDVREVDEVKAARIPGSIHIPLAHCSAQTIPEHEGKKLAFQCAVGGRSAKACQIYLGFNSDSTPYNVEGGIQAWIASGFSIEQG